MNRILLAFFLLSLASCGAGDTQKPPLAGARIGGPFALTDQDGRTVRDSDFAGRYRIVYFGYTFCPDVCPTDMQKIGQALHQLDKQAPRIVAKLAPIFITVDPERDNPAAIKQFINAFHSKITGLTGTPATIAQVEKAYAVYAKKQPPGPGGGYMVDHVAIAYLMGPEGQPITTLPLEKDGAAVAAEIQRWVR